MSSRLREFRAFHFTLPLLNLCMHYPTGSSQNPREEMLLSQFTNEKTGGLSSLGKQHTDRGGTPEQVLADVVNPP